MVNYHGRLVESMPGEVVIRFAPTVTRDVRLRIASSLGLAERLFLESTGLGAYTILSGESVEDAIDAAAKTTGVVEACPSVAARLLSCYTACGGTRMSCSEPNEIYYPGQSGHLGLTDIDRAWNDPSIYGSRSNPNITIWVIDSGADTRHPDLVDKFIYDASGNPYLRTTPRSSSARRWRCKAAPWMRTSSAIYSVSPGPAAVLS
jgi:hypothetical protein